MYVNDWGAQNFKKSSSHQKVLDTRRVIWNKFSTENPQKLGVNVKKKSVARAIWRSVFTHGLYLPDYSFFRC